MINEILEFAVRKSIETMITDNQKAVNIQLIADTRQNNFDLKINGKRYSKKMKSLAANFNKQQIDEILDVPMNIKIEAEYQLSSLEFSELRSNGDAINFQISSNNEYAERFLKAYSKDNTTISIPAKSFPDFNNPRM